MPRVVYANLTVSISNSTKQVYANIKDGLIRISVAELNASETLTTMGLNYTSFSSIKVK